ncbi:hypothetical protein GCM10007872_33260 [Gluconobacter sphaericus NBRC 12467]|uniref:Uncharacterized protein n=1 Tax=Gluconobacter sphaericus NBRC 12467 TaxID=1307951 RepID=A0AA37SK00_9PROT|nr:hypothetical protein AA12467_0849 [Gluconobacter sphaericus NBRC 12467]GEB42960.1 hypothetical protein GSP01_17420 [Gluconobacter sphaericus NBRC 12467]GLQ86411.1 hypothetical protein GCM10007872_33260 [Gluconobacter sphaericus NBRC 12467]
MSTADVETFTTEGSSLFARSAKLGSTERGAGVGAEDGWLEVGGALWAKTGLTLQPPAKDKAIPETARQAARREPKRASRFFIPAR